MFQQSDTALKPSQNDSSLLAFSSLLLGVFILSFAAIFTRIAENELSPSATVFNRYYIATVVLVPWQIIQLRINNSSEPNQVIKLQDWAIFVLSSILGTSAIFLWASSLTQTSVANSNLLHNVTPIFAVLGGWLFLGQSFDYKFLLGMLLAIIGIFIISFGDFHSEVNSLYGDSLALLSAVFYALNYLVREKLRSKFSASTILLWTCLLSGCFTFLITLTTETQLFPNSWQTWLAVICLAVLCQIIGQGLLIHNLKQFSSAFVTLLMLTEPLLTALFAFIIFAEKLSPLNWVAFIVVLIGIYIAKLSISSAKVVE
ncbi:DMT family transporter [Cylindrospermopsis raciborskii]|uniref:DMT family transporter n=1 Tax=Cylindrospermopsis raciborskii TaxID=77022 RepID=UPI0007789E27|nr:DMT family transporter [Cylindrospermopsis raciborskii]MCZ2202876.1 DMT family transporter [Cylindrospermopsis raciborskii PAMP2012]MCZ2207270.1 DMT family transporter [Cylindrospermopsis raciborskii PAMP2011]